MLEDTMIPQHSNRGTRSFLSALVAGSMASALAWTAIVATPQVLAQDTPAGAPPAAAESARPQIHTST